MSDRDTVRLLESNALMFYCAGCEEYHAVAVKPAKNPATGASWTWNGDYEKPTLSPSILVHGSGRQPTCHSYISRGLIQYLSDCGHRLAGHTVPLKPIHSI